ncbi:MAG: hypothetical protein WC900_10745 [Oscillospiraceae bacterium]
MDFNADELLSGRSMNELLAELFEFVLLTASEKSKK